MLFTVTPHSVPPPSKYFHYVTDTIPITQTLQKKKDLLKKYPQIISTI